MTRLKLVLLVALLMTLGMAGCGTKNIAIPAGATGVVIKKGVVAFPDAEKKLVPGDYELEPGDMVRRPLNSEELIKTLKAGGVNVQEPAPSK